MSEEPRHEELIVRNRTTTSGYPPSMPEDAPAPGPINPETGMHTDYWILSEEERQKGFVRPVRRTYIHVGRRLPGEPRPLTDEEKERYKNYDYAAFIPNDDPDSSILGTFIKQKDLDTRKGDLYGGCGVATSMSQPIAETYARQPSFYGRTYCVHCQTHLPVGEQGEFVWEDGTRVGT